MGLIFEPGQHIYASFSGQPKPNDTEKEVTIILHASRPGGVMRGNGRIGFSLDNLTYGLQSTVVKYGEQVTVYAEGDEFQVDEYNTSYYYCVGFYSESNSTLKSFTDDNIRHSYTFTATKDMEISAGWQKR